MATKPIDAEINQVGAALGRSLSVLRLAVTGALVAVIFFALCWAAIFLPIGSATHMYLQLFTLAEASSTTALVEGVCWSAIFGALTGGLFAAVYNATASFDRR